MRGRVSCLSICGPRLRLSLRPRQYSVVLSPKTETVQVPTGSNGSISLEMIHGASLTPPAHLLISLPRGLDLPSSTLPSFEPTRFTRLAQIADTTVVRINYRLSAQSPYPTPIHDVLAGYDWILKNLVRTSGHITFRIGVYGELIGGSLAAMLGLTECRIGGPAISAVLASNPVTDWTAIHEGMSSGGEPGHADKSGNQIIEGHNSQSLPVRALLETRSKIFRKLESFFDPFASPLLFFRTASSDLPSNEPLEEPPPDGTPPPEWIRKRRVYRRHPPTGSGLKLPRVRVEIGRDNILAEQGRELAEAWRRSLGLSGRSGGGKRWEGFERIYGIGRKEGLNVEEMQKAELAEVDGLGFWTEDDLLRAGEWFGDVLRREM